MPFSALIYDDYVHLAGQGADAVWDRAQQVRKAGGVRCRGCGGEMRTKSGRNTVRHFFHLVKPEHCLLGESEGATHLRAKMAVAAAIENSGGTALVEYIASDRSFVVDVLGVWTTNEGSTRRVAFEVQVSSQTEEVTAQRTVQRSTECDDTVWVLMRHPKAEGWPVEELGLPRWSNAWAGQWPSIRADHDLTIAGLVAHAVDGSRPRWRSTDLHRLVAAIGTGRAVWFDQSSHSGWVTPALRDTISRSIAEQEVAAETQRINRARFVARQHADLGALRRALIADGMEPETVSQRPMHAHGQPLQASGVGYLVLPSVWQISTRRCITFIKSHIVVANDPADRRRLAEKGIAVVTVAEATSADALAATATVAVEQAKAREEARRQQQAAEDRRRSAAAAATTVPRLSVGSAPACPVEDDIGPQMKSVRQELTDALDRAGVPWRAPYGGDSGTLIAGDIILRVLPNGGGSGRTPIYIGRDGLRKSQWVSVNEAIKRAAESNCRL